MTRDDSPSSDDSAPARVLDDRSPPGVAHLEASERYRARFDPSTRRATEAVLSAVATATGCDPLDLPPLYSTVDPDALDALVTPGPDGRHRQDATASFEYVGCRVSVGTDGTVLVEPPEDAGTDEQ